MTHDERRPACAFPSCARPRRVAWSGLCAVHAAHALLAAKAANVATPQTAAEAISLAVTWARSARDRHREAGQRAARGRARRLGLSGPVRPDRERTTFGRTRDPTPEEIAERKAEIEAARDAARDAAWRRRGET